MTRSASIAVLAAGVAFAALNTAFAQDTFKPNIPSRDGQQLNTGETSRPPGGAPPGQNEQSGSGTKVENKAASTANTSAGGEKIPTLAEARAALMKVELKDVAIGQVALPPPAPSGTDSAAKATGDNPNTTSSNNPQQTTGSSQTDKSANVPNRELAPPKADAPQTEAQKAAMSDAIVQASRATSPGKPIGSTAQTVPAKYSERNALLDRVPVMAVPLRLSDEDRSRIFKAVMADASPATPGADDIKAAGQLPSDIAMNHMQPLPQSVAGIGGIESLKFVKGKGKVLLVRPTTGVVIEEISGGA